MIISSWMTSEKNYFCHARMITLYSKFSAMISFSIFLIRKNGHTEACQPDRSEESRDSPFDEPPLRSAIHTSKVNHPRLLKYD